MGEVRTILAGGILGVASGHNGARRHVERTDGPQPRIAVWLTEEAYSATRRASAAVLRRPTKMLAHAFTRLRAEASRLSMGYWRGD